MKKLLLILVVLLMSSVVVAQEIEWIVANQATVQWDEVTTLESGDPIPSGTISYEVFIVKAEQDKSEAVLLGETPNLSFLITFSEEGNYLWGVQTLRQVNSDIMKSGISWSDDGLSNLSGIPEGVKFFELPAAPKGQR
jgi:hypothetical protein